MSQTHNFYEDSEDTSESMYEKACSKISPIGKLYIIYCIDNGHSKTDIAKTYSVHPQNITYIYKQRELILKKYTKKYMHLHEIWCVNLNEELLDWFKVQISNNVIITKQILLEEAMDLIKHLNKEFTYIDEWLLDFRQRHNIVKYVPEIRHSDDAIDEWMHFKAGIDPDKLYVCQTCAITHSLFLDSYAAGEEPSDYLSIFFIAHTSGTHKRQLAIVGKEQLTAESNIASLPVNYYSSNGHINQYVITNHLKQWDNELTAEGKTVFLAMPVNSSLMNMQLKNIRIIESNSELISKNLEKIVECFKYQYRRIQLDRIVEYGNDLCLSLLDYIDMISLAWFNVPNLYIKQMFFPPMLGCLYMRDVDSCDGNHSLVQWCEDYNIPLDLQYYGHCLDQYIFCDRDLKSVDVDDTAEPYVLDTNAYPSSSMEAYQAMKRLLSYVQGERASEHVLKSAKLLENHLEYGALLEINTIIGENRNE